MKRLHHLLTPPPPQKKFFYLTFNVSVQVSMIFVQVLDNLMTSDSRKFSAAVRMRFVRFFESQHGVNNFRLEFCYVVGKVPEKPTNLVIFC